jgi:hypothetical protein
MRREFFGQRKIERRSLKFDIFEEKASQPEPLSVKN